MPQSRLFTVPKTDPKPESYYRGKLQAWCKILGNRRRIAHYDRFSFIKWAYGQARDKDKLREEDLAYLDKVCQIAKARVTRITLKRAKQYENAIIGYRKDDTEFPEPRHFKDIIEKCSCSKCIKQ